MTSLQVNPLSFILGRELFFQYRQQIKVLQLPPVLWKLLRRFYWLPSLAPRAVDADSLGIDVGPLVGLGVLVPADEVEKFLRCERKIILVMTDSLPIYLALAATQGGIAWWFEHDGIGPLICFGRNGSVRRRPSRQAVCLLDNPLIDLGRNSGPSTPGAAAFPGRRGSYFIGEPSGRDLTMAKEVLNHRFSTWGVGVPKQAVLPRSAVTRSADRRMSLAAAIEYNLRLQWGAAAPHFPLIVKPAHESFSRGVMLVRDMSGLVAAAKQLTRRFDQTLVVESFVRGADWRIFVLANDAHAVIRRRHPCVYGDGRHSVRELLERQHHRRLSRFRRRGYLRTLNKPGGATLRKLLTRQDVSLDKVVKKGRRIALTFVQLPGPAIDGPDSLYEHCHWSGWEPAYAVSPHVLQLVLDLRLKLGASRLVFDLTGRSISGAAMPMIIEANDRPGVNIFEEPDIGAPQPVATMMLTHFLHEGLSVRQARLVTEACRAARGVQ